jgi:predicted phosphodiesterase
MRLWIMSDLHLEFAPLSLPEVRADAMVLAGDVHVGIKGIDWCREYFPWIPVIYVPGNHEYYGGVMPRLKEKLRLKALKSNVMVLDDDITEIDGITFLGTTLWTDFRLLGDPLPAMNAAKEAINDYRRIRIQPTYRRLKPEDTAVWHRRSRDWLTARLTEPPPGPVVVVSHHAPSTLSLGDAEPLGLLSAAFASRLEDLITNSRAAIWIHGHIHKSVNYHLGNTRVVCNARGYPEETDSGFDPALVVEI